MTKSFQFKQFIIETRECGMPVSTDSVLLGAWAKANPNDKILDMGTGTGILALMMAQRFSDVQITAIDIDAHSIETATFNITQSPWAKRIQLQKVDVKKWQTSQKFQTIICNPPYFHTGQQTQNQRRAIARHTDHLSFDDLIIALNQFLDEGGTAHLILPTEAAQHIIAHAKSKQLHCTRILNVQTTPHKPVSRLLFSLQKNSEISKRIPEQKNLCIHQNNQYSLDFIQLTKDFYLKM